MDDAHLLQCARGDLPVFDRRSGTSARYISRARALHRASLPSSRRNFHAHLHRGLALLRRESLAGLSKHPAPNMTRRGSLIYYLAAWALGCFFMVLVLWCWAMVRGLSRGLLRGGAEGFLSLIFYGYLVGAPTALLYGFLLRRVMRPLQCTMAGGILAPLLVAVLAAVCRSAAHVPPEYDAATVYPLAAAQAIVEVGWWLTIPAGIATAYYLGRIQRVFAPTAETTPSSSV